MRTRKLLVAVLIIALLAVYYMVGTDYLKQRRDNTSLASRITESTQALALIPPPPADLEAQVADARTALDGAKNVFPEQLNSTRIIDYLLKLADEAGVKAIPLLTQPWAVQSVGGKDYSILRLQVAVSGIYNNMFYFLSGLESGDFETLVMERVIVNGITAPFKGDGTYGDSVRIDAQFEIAVYSQPPVVVPEPEEVEEEGLPE